MKKLMQFKIMKFSSDRLKDAHNKIEITVHQGVLNGEIVSLGESELIRIVNRLKGVQVDSEIIKKLLKTKKIIKKQLDSRENRKKVTEINKNIESMLFIPELVNVEFTDPRHYETIIKNGLFINNKKYVRLLTGAGMARRSTVQFVEEEFGKLLKPILDNDRNKSVPLVDSKLNAYYALVSSASYSVRTPRFCVVSDYEFTKDRLVDFVCEEEGKGDWVEERFMPIKTNAFDGQGIVSLEFAKLWAEDMGIKDYVPNSFCIRGAYLKGQCVAFDFKAFAKRIAKKNFIKDAWGQEVNVNEVDVILTVSQLKLWTSYSSCDDYMKACEKNGIGWGISRATPKVEKDSFYTSYQLLQVLDLTEQQVQDMCRPTVEWIKNITTGNASHSLLYLLGDMCKKEELEDGWFDTLDNWNLKAVLLNSKLAGDSYFKKNVHQSLSKKIKESKMGKILLPGNWQVCISDPYAFCEHVFNLPVKGLLQEGEHYCKYWIDKGVYTLASGRSPLTFISEMNTLHLKNDDYIKDWFGHIHSGVIFNIHGVDTMLMADGDFDYDITFTTSQKEFILGTVGGKPVTYEKGGVEKKIIDESKLYLADIRTMGSKIGFLTNMGTAFYSIIDLFKKDSEEYREIMNRLIIIRKLQGIEIDRAKNGKVNNIPKWDRWIKITDTMTPEERESANFKNKIMANRRPRFMTYLYPDYMSKYKKHREIYNNYCESIYGFGIDELLAMENRNNYQEEVVSKYNDFNIYVDSDSIMGFVCRYMEEQFDSIKMNLADAPNFSFDCLINKDIKNDPLKLKKMKELYKRYKSIKSDMFNLEDGCESADNKIDAIKQDAYKTVSSDGSELANLAVWICYQEYKSSNRDFCWKVFGEEVVSNLWNNNYSSAYIPMKDEIGDILYLENKYSNLLIDVTIS